MFSRFLRMAARYGGSSTRRSVRKRETIPTGMVEEKDPAPRVVIDDPSADGGADGRRSHHGNAVNRERHAALFGPEGVGPNGLFAGLESSACRPLQHAEEHQQPQR